MLALGCANIVKFTSLILPHLHPIFYYKLGLQLDKDGQLVIIPDAEYVRVRAAAKAAADLEAMEDMRRSEALHISNGGEPGKPFPD